MSEIPVGDSSEFETFGTDASALHYLASQISSDQDPQQIDLTVFNRSLFAVPPEVHPNKAEYKTDSGFETSYELVDVSGTAFDTCYPDLRGDSSFKGGAWLPIFYMRDLTLRSPNFSYSQKYPESKQHANINGIYWLPGLGTNEAGLSHDYVNPPKRNVYLVGQDGFFARPIDLLGFLHEVGHIETFPALPKGLDTETHHYLGGENPMTAKLAAYTLQREAAANEWALAHAMPLFTDLGLSADAVLGFYRRIQPFSYHNYFRKLFLSNQGSPEATAK